MYKKSSSDSVLDENNGRFCITPDYPNGTYAYFTTMNGRFPETFSVFKNYKKPAFPYVIGHNYHSIQIILTLPMIQTLMIMIWKQMVGEEIQIQLI